MPLRKIISRSPTRVDLSGGTLDIWPISIMVPNAKTVNLAIDIKTEVVLEELKGESILIDIEGLDFKKRYEDREELLNETDSRAQFAVGLFQMFSLPSGLSLTLRSEAPVGSGLGGSSSLAISAIQGFKKLLHLNWTKIQTVSIARDFETQLLGTPAGIQDYIPALVGGLCEIHHEWGGFTFENIDIDITEFDKRSFLVYSGKPHHSGLSNWQILKSFIEGDQKMKRDIEAIRDKTLRVIQLLKQQKFSELSKEFEKSFQIRSHFSEESKNLVKIREDVLNRGASSVKICGAGSGGCLYVWLNPKDKQNIFQLCQKKYKVLNVFSNAKGNVVVEV